MVVKSSKNSLYIKVRGKYSLSLHFDNWIPNNEYINQVSFVGIWSGYRTIIVVVYTWKTERREWYGWRNRDTGQSGSIAGKTEASCMCVCEGKLEIRRTAILILWTSSALHQIDKWKSGMEICGCRYLETES